MKIQKLNCRQARWALYLLRFDFTLKHVLGMRRGKVDGLSRRLDWKVKVEKNNKNQVVVKEDWLRSMQEVVIEGPKVVILEKIKKARSKNKDIVKIVEEMKKAGVKELWGNEWQVEGELVLKEEKIYVPKEAELRAEIIWSHHDILTARYSVVATTRHKLQ